METLRMNIQDNVIPEIIESPQFLTIYDNFDGLDPDIDDSFLRDIDYDFGGKYDYDVEGSLETVVQSVKMSQPLISLIYFSNKNKFTFILFAT
jgi:hypothetical protein